MIQAVFDFLNTAKHATLIILCTFAVILFLTTLYWLETTKKEVKLWPPEITTPESDEIKACLALQAAFHDALAGLESERQSAYRIEENDRNAMIEQTKLRLEAIARDMQTTKETERTHHENEQIIVDRMNALIDDENNQAKIIDWTLQTMGNLGERVNQACGSILPAKKK